MKLAIELDGRHHETSWRADYETARTRELQSHGVEVLRISNEILIRDSLLVEEMILAAIRRRE